MACRIGSCMGLNSAALAINRAVVLLLIAFTVMTRASGKDEIVQKPVMETTADVLFVGCYTENSLFAVYTNGKRQQFATDGGLFAPGESNSLRLKAASSHLIAIAATPMTVQSGQELPPLGIIASLEQHTRTPELATTDVTWKCRHGSPAMRRLKEKKSGRKWFHPGYDDSHWPTAKVLGKHGDKPWEVLMDVSSEASWIWAHTDDQESTVLCRGWVSHNPDVMYLSADSQFTAYADGRLLGAGSDWEKTYRFPIPGQPVHLVAIHARHDDDIFGVERQAGILASLQTPHPPGGVSNRLWKCKRVLSVEEQATWTKPSFDDSAWLLAKQQEPHGGEDSMKGVRIDISQHAVWVWGAGKKKEGKMEEVYCRARMSSNLHAHKVKKPSSETSGASDGHLPMAYFHPRDHFEKIAEVDISRMDTTTFFRDFLSRGRPFVIRGGISSWPAVSKWTDEYLLHTIGRDSAMMTKAPDNTFYFYSQKRDITEGTVGDFLRKYQDPDRKKNLYLAQHPLQSNGERSAIREDVKRPPFSNTLYLEDAYMWMGGGNQLTPVHFDNSENIMCMVAGKKVVKVYEPAMSNFLYPIMQNKHTAITSRIKNLSNPNQDEFPDFSQAKALTVTLEAGDLFFLPAYWWHEVTSYGRNIAVNWWFNTHSYVLDAVYNKWIEGLPQTQWGLEQQQMHDEERQQEEEKAMERRGGERRSARGDEL